MAEKLNVRYAGLFAQDAGTQMDALSDVLRVVRMKGGVFLNAEFSAPWCISSQLGPDDCALLLKGAQHFVMYHYVIEGRFLARHGDGPMREVHAGQVIMLPHNDKHFMGSDFNAPIVPSRDLVTVPPDGGLWQVRHGGGGEKARMVCGFLGCDLIKGNPLIDSLPPMLIFDTGDERAPSWIKGTLEFAAAEILAGRAGSETVLAKLSELLFVEALRRYVDALPTGQTGWLAGIRDPFISRALARIHADVAKPWTVDDLGKEVGLSRSALADRFAAVMGETPIRYLARWRLQVAAHLLRTSDAAMAQVAEQVGYTEFAFSRAFKKEFGDSPAAWRRAEA
jgi:AraC-like DNA-binding protein